MFIEHVDTIFYILCNAAVNGDIVDDELLAIASDADINGPRSSIVLATPLFIAASRGHTKLVRQLIQSTPNLDVNRPGTKNGSTALFVAAEHGHSDIVRLLIHHKDIDVNRGLFSPLYVAAQNGHLDAVKALLEHPDTVRNVFTNGHTPYSISVLHGHTDVADFLLSI